MGNKIPAYVLNDYLKFERKVYSLFGVTLGRSLPFKAILYFGVTASALFIAGFLPLIGGVVSAIPVIVRIMLAAAIAYLLTDVGTENRSPLRFFQSFIRYHWSKLRNETFYRGKVLPPPRSIRFAKGLTISYEKPYAERENDNAANVLKKPVKFKGITYR